MERIQRKRTKGWRKPENTINIARPSKWGNPIKVVGDSLYIDASYRRKVLDPWVFYKVGTQDEAVALYKNLLTGKKFDNADLQHWCDELKKLDLTELKSHNVMCFCSMDEKCHGDVLIEAVGELEG